MGNLTRGENGIELIILLSFILIPLGFVIYLMVGWFDVVGILIWAFGLLAYISIIANVSIRVPEKHRKAVHGKNFLDMKIHRNKEQRRDYLFGVLNHQPLMVTDIDVQLIEHDEKYEEIRLSLCVDTERQMLIQELNLRGDKPIIDQLVEKSFDPNSAELDRDVAHQRIGQIETKMIARIGSQNKDPELMEIHKQIKENSTKIEDIQTSLNKIINTKNVTAKTDKMVTVPTKKLSEMTNSDIEFRITELDECAQRMEKLSNDDYLMALQYRLFQLRRIFSELFSKDVHVEIVHNYQPVEYFETGMVFDYFILVMRRPYTEEFLFQEEIGSHENFTVTIQSAPCASVTAGFALSDIPMFVIIYSPADADKKVDVVISAQELYDLKMKILIKMINWYKTEYENADLRIMSEQTSANYYLSQWDDLRQQIEEGEWEPNQDDFGYTERIVKVVPGSAKAYMVVMTLAFLVILWLYITSMYTNALIPGDVHGSSIKSILSLVSIIGGW